MHSKPVFWLHGGILTSRVSKFNRLHPRKAVCGEILARHLKSSYLCTQKKTKPF